MNLENRLFVSWDEASELLGFDREGLRQAMLEQLGGRGAFWLPVCIDSKGHDYLARLEVSGWHSHEVKWPKIWELEHQDVVHPNGTVIRTNGKTQSALWDSTHEHKTGWKRCVYLSGRLILCPETVTYACQADGDLKAMLTVVAPREWCLNGFPDDCFHFVLIGGDHGYMPRPDSLYEDAFFYMEDVRLAQGYLASQRSHPALPTCSARLAYPPELQAALDAFEAVRIDPKATEGRSPRAALLRWLMEHRPEIGTNARDRIATVANWQPSGGAPKTPGF
jgi:hypothetical protein